MAFSLVKAEFASVIGESIFFGLFSMLFALSTYLLLFKRTISGPARVKFFVALTLMYILAIAHIGVSIRYSLEGLIEQSDGNTGALEYFLSVKGTLVGLKIIIYVLQTLLGDGIMIYRLYVVCGTDCYILFPALFLLAGNVVSGIGSIASFFVYGSVFDFGAKTFHWLIGFFLISLFINISGTVTITLRIWLVTRRTMALVQESGFSPLMVMLLDPGIIYTISLLSLLAQFFSANITFYATLQWETPLIGIVFALIIVRIGFKKLWNGRLDYMPTKYRIQSPLRTSQHRTHIEARTPSFGITLDQIKLDSTSREDVKEGRDFDKETV